jgi:NAD(P)-dependent dehydrogenase (short-subunit alcohol dehydrogenase family)
VKSAVITGGPRAVGFAMAQELLRACIDWHGTVYGVDEIAITMRSR